MQQMHRMEFTDEQLMTLRAVWQYFTEDESGADAIGEALGIDPEDRGMNEDGEYTDEDGEINDPLVKRIGELTTLIMSD
jgi:hypothetical protein